MEKNGSATTRSEFPGGYDGPSHATSLLQIALDQILAAIRDAHDIQCGVVYYWSPSRQSLICQAYGDHGVARVLSELAYHRDDRAFATKVFRQPDECRGLVELDPASPDVEQRRRLEYKIDGPLLGVPLKNAQHKKVGVLVLWNRRDYGRDVCERDLVAIESLANLAATCIDALNYQLETRIWQRKLLDTLRRVQTEATREGALRHVLKLNLANNAPDDPLAFERVRLFLYDKGTNRFRGYLCEGMNEHAFRSHWIAATNEACARRMVQLAREGLPRAVRFTWRGGFAKCRGEWPSAHKDFSNPTWVAAPLVVGGRLLGMIEADNGFGPRPILREAQDLLEAMSAIAASAVAVHDITDKLASEYSQLLKEQCWIRDSELTVYSLVLMHLTCHFGLKFQRAFYFIYSGSSHSLNFKLATGSLRASEHGKIAGRLADWTYHDLLRNAASDNDRDLNLQLNQFKISIDDGVKSLLDRPLYLSIGSPDLTPPLSAVLDRLRMAVNASCIMTAPVKAAARTLGVFIVDSPFDGVQLNEMQSFTPADQRAFRNFVENHISPIFERNRYINSEDERRSREEEIEKINVVRHELKRIPSRLERLVLHHGDVPVKSIKPVLAEVQRFVSTAQDRLVQIYHRLRSQSSVAPWTDSSE